MPANRLRMFALAALAAAGSLNAADATPPPAPAVAPVPAGPATPAPRQEPAATSKAPAAKPIPPFIAALQPSDNVLTFTLDNYNQIVAMLREKDAQCLTLETAEGLMKLRIDKVLSVTPGGTLKVTQGAGAATGGATRAANAGSGAMAGPAASGGSGGSAGAANPNTPLSQMTPDERIKAAKELLKNGNTAGVTYQQAIQNHVGGVPQGVAPTTYNQLQQKNNPNAIPTTTLGSSQNWQPFASDNPKAKQNGSNGNTTQNNQNQYNQQYQQWLQQQQYQNFGFNPPYQIPIYQTYGSPFQPAPTEGR